MTTFPSPDPRPAPGQAAAARWAGRWRVGVATALATALPMSVSFINLGKALVYPTALLVLLLARGGAPRAALARLWTVRVLLLVLAVFTLGLLWTTASTADALLSWSKHAKLLTLLLLLVLLRTRREATIALGGYFLMSSFGLLLSWLSFHGVPMPWNDHWRHPQDLPGVLSTNQLEQGIITAVYAALCWHLRGIFAWPPARPLLVLAALLALANVFYVLPGRTGYLTALVLLALAIWWRAPPRRRAWALLAGALLIGAVALTSGTVRQRALEVQRELSSYIAHAGEVQRVDESSSIRLNFWRRSLQSIAEHPWRGTGPGSWQQRYLHYSGDRVAPGTETTRNPHQEFLLWGVELGIGGMALLAALLSALARDARRLPVPARHALLSVLAALTVACLFNSALYDSLLGDYFCSLLGLLLAFGIASAPVASSAAVPDRVPV